jgi:hypothetical protein
MSTNSFLFTGACVVSYLLGACHTDELEGRTGPGNGQALGGGEGDEAGECRDGLDNDDDGYWDCDDAECASSADCKEPDTCCGWDSWGDTGNSHLWATPARFSYRFEEDGSWSCEVDLDGRADLVVLDITENADNPWRDSHDLEEQSFTYHPKTDVYGINLLVVQSPTNQYPGVSTLFDEATEPHMVWMFTAYIKSVAVDCGVFASDGDISAFDAYGCIEVE